MAELFPSGERFKNYDPESEQLNKQMEDDGNQVSYCWIENLQISKKKDFRMTQRVMGQNWSHQNEFIFYLIYLQIATYINIYRYMYTHYQY